MGALWAKLGHLQIIIISQLSRPALSHYRMYDRERSSQVHSCPVMVQVIYQLGSCVLHGSCTDLPYISWLSAIDREPRTMSWVGLSGRLWTQSSCLFGYDFSPDEVIARP